MKVGIVVCAILAVAMAKKMDFPEKLYNKAHTEVRYMFGNDSSIDHDTCRKACKKHLERCDKEVRNCYADMSILKDDEKRNEISQLMDLMLIRTCSDACDCVLDGDDAQYADKENTNKEDLLFEPEHNNPYVKK